MAISTTVQLDREDILNSLITVSQCFMFRAAKRARQGGGVFPGLQQVRVPTVEGLEFLFAWGGSSRYLWGPF